MKLRRKTFSFVLIIFLWTSLPLKIAHADLFGGDVAVLVQILAQAIDQVYKLQAIIGKATETVRLLEEMNRGVKEVLKLAETAHIPLPPGVYEKAKKIDQAALEARRIYGAIQEKSPPYIQTHYQSGVEGLHLSQDTFDYSTFLDKQGESVKTAAVIASQASATRLTAETLGVLLHSMSHANRLQAKNLEITSSNRLEESAKDSARYESFVNTHTEIEKDLRKPAFSSLNGLVF